MAENQGTTKRRLQLPAADDVVQVDAPKADNAANKGNPEAARAQRAQDISAAKGKDTKEPAKPAFVPNATRIAELRALSDEDLVARAVKDAGMVAAASGDRRLFMWTGATTDGLRGQPVDRSKLRSAVVDFLKSRTGFKTEDKAILSAARANKRDFVHGNGDSEPHTVDHVAEGRVIHAYMFLAGTEVHGGKYDIGYVATRRGENKARGMVARGYLRQIGDATPAAVVEAQVAEEKAAEVENPEVVAQE